MGPRTGLHNVEKKKFSPLSGLRSLGCPARSQSLYRLVKILQLSYEMKWISLGETFVRREMNVSCTIWRKPPSSRGVHRRITPRASGLTLYKEMISLSLSKNV
jgi:hypothetical protein